MGINYLPGFRRLGWVAWCLSLLVVMFVSYYESQEFGGFSKDRIWEFMLVDKSGKSIKLTDEFSPDEVITFLTAERNGTLEPRQRTAITELRRRHLFPFAWEIETKKLNKTKFAGLVVLLGVGLMIFIQGGITLLAWILRGFIKEP